MAKHWCYFFFLLWFSYLTISAILLFTSGFLLNRIALNKNSSCIPHSEVTCAKNGSKGCSSQDTFYFALKTGRSVCLQPKARVVLLIIDALRYDFTLYDPGLNEALPYQNKMPVINELLRSQPKSTRLYNFIADPPTTTMQRLKALTTGSLPTFIDAGSNFATSEIGEDNIIDQLGNQNRSVVFLGDDTWNGLYPQRFTRSYPFPSFNVWDLDTVDVGVTKNIFYELARNDWSLLIAHYLGVDHCGHRYGPNHPEMARKLLEMNEVIRNVTNKLDDDVILFVVGDHGMTGTGDHGGESYDEITSAMFVYSNLALLDQESSKNSVKQVDLIPTLSIILGIPIPFANLGTIILNSLPIPRGGTYEWYELQLLVWTNVQQIYTYIMEYSNTVKVFEDVKLANLEQRFKSLKNHLPSSQAMNDAFEFLLDLRSMCEKVWVQFDSFSMSRGLLFTFLCVFLVYTIVDGVPSNRLSEIFISSYVFYLYLSLALAIFISTACYYMNFVSNLFTNLFFVSGIISIFMLAMVVVQNWDVISLNWYESSKRRNWVEILCRMILLISLCSFFSNSFIVEEAYVSLFLLMSLVIVILIELMLSVTNRSIKSVKNSIVVLRKSVKIKLIVFSVAFCVFVRMSMYFLQCREEHNCSQNQIKSATTASRFEWFVTLLSLALLVTLTRIFLRSCGNLSGYSVTTILAQYAPTIIIVCSLGFWVLRNLPNNSKIKLVSTWQVDVLAWIVFILIFLGILFIYIKPLSLYVLPKRTDFDLQHHSENVIPQLFKQVKTLFDQKRECDDVPIICGLGTVYSAAFSIASIYIVLLFALLLGYSTAPSAVLMYFATMTVFTITSIARYEKANTVGQLLNVPTTSILLWVILSRYFFYGTGHQATFPNIAWEAAFVGTGGVFTYNFIPAALIIINTFGSYILLGFMLPLLQIAPFTLYMTIASLVNKKIGGGIKDMSRGDVLLYENDSEMFDNTFVLCSKYLSCHAIHVFAGMLSVTIHCRHLMVWKIFAPKFIFESIAMFVTVPSVLLGYLLLVRINTEVDRLVKSLNKRAR